MQFPIDADLAVFLYTVSKVLRSLPRLRKIPTSRVPMLYRIEKIDPAALTDRQAKYFAPYNEKLSAMNYWPVCTYRIANYGHNLLRNYVNPMETAHFVVLIHEVALRVKGRPSPTNSCTISFHTRFSDATILTTRNMQVRTIMDRPPYQTVQERPEISEPAELKREHDRKVATLGCPVAPPSDADSIFRDVQAEHVRFSEFQLSCGNYKPLLDGSGYAFADRVHWRGIRNHLNPFAHRFSLKRFLPAALTGLALPLLAVMYLAPAAGEATRNTGFPPLIAAESVTLFCYLIAGAIIGYLLERNTFVWVFLLTYLALRLFTSAHIGPLPYSAFAGSVAYSVAQAKKRKRAVLLPA
jgi:hypothetical protein